VVLLGSEEWRLLGCYARRLALVRTDALEELSSSIIRVTRIGELGTLAVTSTRCMLHAASFDFYR
jgi:hypothetical protein